MRDHRMKGCWALWLLAALLPVQAQSVRYVHTDALGTPVAMTDANRNVVQRSEYEPYGDLLNRGNNDRPGYTGHVMDSATGLTYMQQRYYDPGVGMFLSVDPVTAYSDPVGQFHRYRYANNNPFKFTDPDGRCAASRLVSVCESHGMASTSFRSRMDTGRNQQSSSNPEPSRPATARNTEQAPNQSGSSIAKTVADANALIAGTQQHSLATGDTWRGANGKVYDIGWGGNQHTGPRSLVLQQANALRVAGQGLFLIGSGISLYEGAGALQRGDGFGVARAGVDIGWGAVGTFGGPAGLVGGAAYSGTSFLIGIPSVRQHTVEPAASGMCWASGNC